MKNVFKKSVAVAAFLAASTGVQAANYSWGVHDSFESGASLKFGSFTDNYSFSVAGPSVLESGLGAILGSGTYSLLGFGLDNTMGTVDDVSFGSWGFNSAHNTASLTSGGYYYKVAGQLFGGYGIASSLKPVTAPVPEPETYAMLMAGLGLMGVVVRRRKQN